MTASFPLQVVIQGIDQLTAPIKKAQERVQTALAPMRQLNASLAGLKEAAGLGRVSDALGDVREKIGDAWHEAVVLGAKIAGIGVAAGGAITALVVGFAHAGTELTRLSAKLGVGVEDLQRWRYAARLTEVQDSDLEQGLTLLEKNVGLAARRMGPASVALRRLGVDVLDASKHVRPLSDLLPEIADKLNDLDDPGLRTTRTLQIFGRAGANLTPLLREGSAGIREMGDEAKRLGAVMSEDDVRAGHEFTKSWERLKTALEGVRNQIARALLPILGDLLNRLKDWLIGHKAQIQEWVDNFRKWLPGALKKTKDALDDLWKKLKPLLEVLGELVDKFGAAKVAAAAFALILGGKLAFSVLSIVPSLINLAAVLSTTLIPAIAASGTTMGGFAAATWAALAPVIAVAAAAASLGYLAVVVNDNWSALSSFFQDMWDDLKYGAWDAWRSIRNSIVGNWSALTSFFKDVWDGLKFGALDAWRSVRNSFDSAIAWISSRVKDLTGVLPDWLVDLFRGSPGGVLAAPAALPSRSASTGGSAAAPAGEARVHVSFEDLPKGARVREGDSSGVDLSLSMGYAFGGAP